MDRAEYLRRWSALHGDVPPSGLVGAWLRVAYALGAPLGRAGVHPDAVTLLGLAVAFAAVLPARAGGRWVLLASALVAVSAVLDGLDGAVAVLTGRACRWGFVLDSACDRLAEAAFAVALWQVGAPGWAAVGAAGVGWLHEYVRARAMAAGMTGVGVVTVSERPTRVLVTAAFLLAAGLRPGAASGWTTGWATAGVMAGIAVGLIGLVQLAVAVRRALR